MARRHHYRLRNKQPMELDVTTFLNLMVVLVPFLLITAVFSRITIVELTLPSSSGGSSAQPPAFHDIRSPRYQNCTSCHARIHGSNSSHLFLR